MADRFGRYRIQSKLGQGAMAAVYLAKDPVLSRWVAVKALHSDLAAREDVLQRFFNEAKTVANLRSPHVVEIHDFGREGREPYLVMEYIDGPSLHGMLKGTGRRGILDARVTAALLCQAASGLSTAARHGVVHRDIKPENLLIDPRGLLKIADFGIAHVHADNHTKTGTILGSPLYMSPEQARGAKPITTQSDMFSLGAVAYRCLAGHPPFLGSALSDLLRKIAGDAHVPLRRMRPDLDAGLLRLVETLLRKDPLRRGGGPQWVHRELQTWLVSRGVLDPVAWVGSYLQDLDGRGMPPTWKNPSPDAGPEKGRIGTRTLANLPATVPALTTAKPAKMAAYAWAAGLALALLGLAGAGGYFWRSSAISPGSGGRAVPAAQGRVSSPGGPVVRPPFPDTGTGWNGEAPESLERLSAAGGAGESDEMGVPDAEPGGGSAMLQIRSAPPFAEVFLDGRFAGVTPVRVRTLPPGNHRMVLKGKTRILLDTLVYVEPGLRTLRFRFDGEGGAEFERHTINDVPEDGGF